MILLLLYPGIADVIVLLQNPKEMKIELILKVGNSAAEERDSSVESVK